MNTRSSDPSYLALPDGAGPHPGVVVVHEAFGLNDNIRGICRRLAADDLKVYPGTKHSFFNDPWRNYEPSAAADSWQRVLDFCAGPRPAQPAETGMKRGIPTMGGGEMTADKRTARARRSRPAQKVVSQRNKVNVALPLSMIRAEQPMPMRAGDWISLAGLVLSVIGFRVVIKQLTRIARALEADQATRRATMADPLAGGTSGPADSMRPRARQPPPPKRPLL